MLCLIAFTVFNPWWKKMKVRRLTFRNVFLNLGEKETIFFHAVLLVPWYSKNFCLPFCWELFYTNTLSRKLIGKTIEMPGVKIVFWMLIPELSVKDSCGQLVNTTVLWILLNVILAWKTPLSHFMAHSSLLFL